LTCIWEWKRCVMIWHFEAWTHIYLFDISFITIVTTYSLKFIIKIHLNIFT
jgi:hypothetical protein